MANITKQPHQRELFGHPIGLYVLFFTETWERFSYYGMRALLVLYMTAKTLQANGQSGLGWLESEALALYGWYTMLVYLMSIPGGFIADRYIGQKKAVTIGAILLTIGHGILAIDTVWAYYTGLGFVILGVGMLKPNISTMVGGLYKQNDIRRDKGFSIFYVGINLGSFLASLSVGLVAKVYGWHFGFGLAGIGMLLGLLVYLYGQRFLVHVGNAPTVEEKSNDISVGILMGQLFKSPLHLTVVGLILIYAVYAGFTYAGADSWGYTALYIVIAFVTGIMMMIYKNLNGQVEKDRYVVLLLSLLIVIVFWGCFEQMGGLMNLYAEQKTNRNLFGWEVPSAWFQAANPGFIILFAVIIANIWARRKLKGKEASSIFKMATGVIIMGVGFVYMVLASKQYASEGSSAMYWLVLAYMFHTIGELCLSPVSLSFFTKLAPARYMALMMGVYWAATGLGNKVAGVIGESSQLKPYEGVMIVSKQEVLPFINKDSIEIKKQTKEFVKIFDYPINHDKSFSLKSEVFTQDGKVVYKELESGKNLNTLFSLATKEDSNSKELLATLINDNIISSNPYHAKLVFKKDKEKAEIIENIGNGKNYGVSFVLDEVQSEKEYNTFKWLTIFAVLFGILIILIIKPLKRLTHGAEDNETIVHDDETEGFELSNH